MPTQYITIAKVGGDAGEAIVQSFRAWTELRTVTEPDTWEPSQWPQQARDVADRFAEQLKLHAAEPPVVFYVEYVDTWSSFPPGRYLSKADELVILSDRFEQFCLPLPLARDTLEQLKKLKSSGQWPEDRLFATLALTGAEAWEGIVNRGALVFLRYVVGGLVTDEEVVSSLSKQPDWIPHS